MERGKMKEYLNGEILSKKLGVDMWRIFDMQVKRFDYYDTRVRSHNFQRLIITPLGVACLVDDTSAIFDDGRSKEIYEGYASVLQTYTKVNPEEIRFNAEAIMQRSAKARITVKVKENGTVGIACVKALSFVDQADDYEKMVKAIENYMQNHHNQTIIATINGVEVLVKE